MTADAQRQNARGLLVFTGVLNLILFTWRAVTPMTEPTSVVYLVLLLVLLAFNIVALGAVHWRTAPAVLGYLWGMLLVIVGMAVVDRLHGATDLPLVIALPGLLAAFAWSVLRVRLAIVYEAACLLLPLLSGWFYDRIGQAVGMALGILVIAWIGSKRREAASSATLRGMTLVIEEDNRRRENVIKQLAQRRE